MGVISLDLPVIIAMGEIWGGGLVHMGGGGSYFLRRGVHKKGGSQEPPEPPPPGYGPENNASDALHR